MVDAALCHLAARAGGVVIQEFALAFAGREPSRVL